MKLIDTVAVSNELGEGVIWDATSQRIMWTDIVGKQLFSYCPITQQLESWNTPARLCCFAPTAKAGRFVAAFDIGFAFYRPAENQLDWIKKLEQDNTGTRFNDGRTDRQGRLWSGTMTEDPDAASYKGSLYCLHADLSVSKTITGLSIPNSLCWSPDGSIVYHTDTPSRRIKQYAFNSENATFGKPSLFVETDRGCYPDGSIIDADGYLWNAQWGGHKVVRYNPQGKVDFELEVPCAQPSCVAFAGEKLDLLVVTSAWQGLSDEDRRQDPQAGNLFIYQTPYRGLAESVFKEING